MSFLLRYWKIILIKIKKMESKMNKGIFFVLTGTLLCTNIFAKERIGSEYLNNKAFINGVDVPINTNPRKHNLRDKIEMETGKNAAAYKRTQYKSDERNRVFGEIFDVSVLMTPVVRVIRAIDIIGLSPTYMSQIKLPENIKITDVLPSFDTKRLEYEENIIRLRPDGDTFYSGNMIVSFTDGRKNFTMTIFAERYYSDECKKDESGDKYICRRKNSLDIQNSSDYKYAYNNLSTTFVYTRPKALDDFEVISLYERLKRKSLCIKEDGARDSFSYEGITYSIKRDNNFGGYVGGVMYRGIGYRIESSIDSDI